MSSDCGVDGRQGLCWSSLGSLGGHNSPADKGHDPMLREVYLLIPVVSAPKVFPFLVG